MKNCNNCGAEIDEGAIYCPYCGSRYNEKKKKENEHTNTGTGSGGSYDPKYGYIPDYSSYGGGYNGGFGAPVEAAGSSIWIAILSFVLPIVGLILYYHYRFTNPGKAASAANGALAAVSFGTPIIGFILWYVWKHTRPHMSKVCLISAVVGIVFSLAASVFLTVMAEVFGYHFF